MTTEILSELELFQQFVSERLSNGSLDKAVEEFREYQRQLNELKTKLHVAEQQSANGQTGPFDAEATKRRLRERLAKEGITD